MNLALDTALQVATAGLYLMLALALGRRATEPSVRGALNMFRAWWFLLAAVTLTEPLQVLLYLDGLLPIWLYLTLVQVNLLAICGALAALLCYLVYAYQGSTRSWFLVAAGYGAFAAFLLGVVNHAGTPARIAFGPNGLDRDPPIDLAGPVGILLIALLLGPQILASIAYLRLYPKADTPTQRYRIVLIGAAISAWFTVSFVGAVLRQTGPEWQTATRVLGLAAAVLVLLAYFPPPSFQRRFQVRPLGREEPPAVASAHPAVSLAPQDS
ncbi:MAG: hypothetical protein QOD77_1427 [Thermoplasmata archaeon]|jgi:hypothetical protein|nr:hypothetical protein [Thermoplasmata archaeon]